MDMEEATEILQLSGSCRSGGGGGGGGKGLKREFFTACCVPCISSTPTQSRLRSSASPPAGVKIAMAEATFDYSWEYQGNAPKLVYTPLTDKCYLTLTQGMALGMGGNPYGPAGEFWVWEGILFCIPHFFASHTFCSSHFSSFFSCVTS
jgi:hypothetical protein